MNGKIEVRKVFLRELKLKTVTSQKNLMVVVVVVGNGQYSRQENTFDKILSKESIWEHFPKKCYIKVKKRLIWLRKGKNEYRESP